MGDRKAFDSIEMKTPWIIPAVVGCLAFSATAQQDGNFIGVHIYHDEPLPTPPTPAQIKAAHDAAIAHAAADRLRAAQGQTNAVRWLLPQATNGDASAQCSLGLHYLNGQGCATNREQAIFWLQKAAGQGNIEASNKLATLKP